MNASVVNSFYPTPTSDEKVELLTYKRHDWFHSSRTIPPGQVPWGQFPPRTITPWTINPQIYPTRTIAPWTIPLDSSHLGLLYCPWIITPQQSLPRATTITNYSFFMAIFCFFSMAQLYNFCYDNKSNNDNSNKTCSLKLLSIIVM